MRATPFIRRAATVASVAVLGLFGVAATQAGAAPGADFRHACDTAPKPGMAACMALVRTDVPVRAQAQLGPHTPPTNAGYGPASLQGAYLLPSSTQGVGQTVAIVDAYDYPNAEADLATYRSDWGLPPCTTANGCFHKVNEHGQDSPLPAASGTSGWATEEALDIDMVSAVCPNCHILLVEADSTSIDDLGTGVNSAVSSGAAFVSNSYLSKEGPDEIAADAAYYDHPGVAVTAASGDWGYSYGPGFPASSPHVVSVGGTSLRPASDPRGWSESVWTGTGAGCSAFEPKPAWQTDSGCANRTNTDVSAVADPNTGVAVYDTYDAQGWLEVGGTSASSPIIAGTYALVGAPAAGTYPASYLYAHAPNLNDVTSGSNGTCDPAYLCTAGTGYDGPTGLGTPNGIDAFGVPTGNIVTVGNPGDQAATQDVAFSLQIHATDTASDQTLTYTATGLPDGLAIDASTGLISGTPTTVVNASVKVTATDTSGASSFAAFVAGRRRVGQLQRPGTTGELRGGPGRRSGRRHRCGARAHGQLLGERPAGWPVDRRVDRRDLWPVHDDGVLPPDDHGTRRRRAVERRVVRLVRGAGAGVGNGRADNARRQVPRRRRFVGGRRVVQPPLVPDVDGRGRRNGAGARQVPHRWRRGAVGGVQWRRCPAVAGRLRRWAAERRLRKVP